MLFMYMLHLGGALIACFTHQLMELGGQAGKPPTLPEKVAMESLLGLGKGILHRSPPNGLRLVVG
jgi:hypothetical protein